MTINRCNHKIQFDLKFLKHLLSKSTSAKPIIFRYQNIQTVIEFHVTLSESDKKELIKVLENKASISTSNVTTSEQKGTKT